MQLVKPISERAEAREKGRRLKEIVVGKPLYSDAELPLASLAEKMEGTGLSVPCLFSFQSIKAAIKLL